MKQVLQISDDGNTVTTHPSVKVAAETTGVSPSAIYNSIRFKYRSGGFYWAYDLKQDNTERGFARVTFTDKYGAQCSLQKSSLATEDCVWLGADDLGLKVFKPGDGWEEVDPNQLLGTNQWVANTRMHLTRMDVAILLPHLQKFVQTGEL